MRVASDGGWAWEQVAKAGLDEPRTRGSPGICATQATLPVLPSLSELISLIRQTFLGHCLKTSLYGHVTKWTLPSLNLISGWKILASTERHGVRVQPPQRTRPTKCRAWVVGWWCKNFRQAVS